MCVLGDGTVERSKLGHRCSYFDFSSFPSNPQDGLPKFAGNKLMAAFGEASAAQTDGSMSAIFQKAIALSLERGWALPRSEW